MTAVLCCNQGLQGHRIRHSILVRSPARPTALHAPAACRVPRQPLHLTRPAPSHQLLPVHRSTGGGNRAQSRAITMSAGDAGPARHPLRMSCVPLRMLFRPLRCHHARHAELIDGKATAATIRKEIAAEVDALKEKTGKVS